MYRRRFFEPVPVSVNALVFVSKARLHHRLPREMLFKSNIQTKTRKINKLIAVIGEKWSTTNESEKLRCNVKCTLLEQLKKQ